MKRIIPILISILITLGSFFYLVFSLNLKLKLRYMHDIEQVIKFSDNIVIFALYGLVAGLLLFIVAAIEK